MATMLNPSAAEPTDRPTEVQAYGLTSADAEVAPLSIERRALRANDVASRIPHCGICQSDRAWLGH